MANILSPIDLSIIIVNYNVCDFLESLLRSISKSVQDLSVEIIVVDNNSSDGSIDMVHRQFPDVQLIENSDNPGFAVANNQALQVYNGRYACLINPDVLLQEDTLKTMVDFMDRHSDAGAAGCKVLNPDGSLQLACRRSIPTPMSAFFRLTGLSRLFPENRHIGAYNMTYLDPDTPHDVDAVSGSFMIVRRDTINEIGTLDESFFMYGEDLDWFYRMRKGGWRVCYVPDTRVVHYKGESTRRSPHRPAIAFYRAMHIFARKHRTGSGLRLFTSIISSLITLGIILKGAGSLFHGGIRRSLLPLMDLIIINVTPLVATKLRIGQLAPLDETTAIPYLVVHGTYSVVWMSCLYVAGLYDHRRYSATMAATAISVGFILIAAITFFMPSYAFSRAVVLLAFIMNLTMIAGWRWAVGRLIGARRRTIIVGTDEMARAIQTDIQATLADKLQLVGFLDADIQNIGRTIQGVQVYDGNGHLSETLEQHHIDEVIVASTSMTYQEILHLVSACTKLGVGLRLVSEDTQKGLPFKTVTLVDVGEDPMTSMQRIIRRGLRRSNTPQGDTPAMN